MLFASPAAWAAGPAGGISVTEQQRLDALSGNITNLAGQVNETRGEIKQIEKAITVAPPAEGAQPQTVGEHVSVVEKDLGDIREHIKKSLGIEVHGLVDAGYEHNFNQPNGNTNLYRAFDEDGFQLTQGNLRIQKTGTVGFVTDINVGQVANTLSGVTNYSQVFPVGGQWIDPTQYYLTYIAPVGNGINFSAGRFVTLLGAEVIPTWDNINFNETRSLLFNLAIPFTQTGVRANYVFNDYAAVTAGLDNGWDNPGSFNNGGPMYEGQLALNNKEKTVSLLLTFNWGPNLKGHSNSNLGIVDPIFTWKPWFLPNTTLQTEYVYASQSGPVVNGHSATWQGLAQYLVYDWNQWEFAARGEFFQDLDGFRTGVEQTLWELTGTIAYKVPQVDGLVLRTEYRHDNSSSHVFPNNNFVNPTTGLQQLWRGQDTVSANAIFTF